MKLYPRLKHSIAVIIYLSVIIWNFWWCFVWLYQQKISELAVEGNSRLELYITYLQGILDKYERLPELLVMDSSIAKAQELATSKMQLEQLNTYLSKINAVYGASDTYILDTAGRTIAASNWNNENSFIGQNFSYRPYFQDALQGKPGKYFALGSRSTLRGYYFSYPITYKEKISGILALKIDIDSVETGWGNKDQEFLVTDMDGVIFLSTNKDWRFHTLTVLSDTALQHIINSRRYPNTRLEPLKILHEQSHPSGKILSMKDSHGINKYLLQTHFMERAGWNVHILVNTSKAERFVFTVFIAICFLFILIGLLAILIKQRKQRINDLNLFEEQSRRVLQAAKEKLETRVSERTQELTETNTLLRKEIEERKRAEIALRQTRSELVHTAKMAALGQMSAGINHELNQPLAAIRSYSENGKLFLQKGKLNDALWNLEQISELTERMAQVGKQLKQFSRKTSGIPTVVPLNGVIDGALEILGPDIRKRSVAIDVDLVPEYLNVRANHILLQQVLVNLISNALHAVEDAPNKKITITAREHEQHVFVAVTDTGIGIPPEQLPHIFEPFFTTKQPGHGLGLGLTITQRILQEMDGEISATSSAGTTTFEFILHAT